jgi:hypothetical protein
MWVESERRHMAARRAENGRAWAELFTPSKHAGYGQASRL